MAQILFIDQVGEGIRKALARSLQSGNINFLIGSGASVPAIASAGPVEQDIAALLEAGKEVEATRRMYEFLVTIQEPTNALIGNEENANNTLVVNSYSEFLGTNAKVLSERRTTLLPKQATVFTTNYDLFFEKASAGYSALKLNDGFTRVPSLENRMEYSTRNYFNSTYNTGNLYNYKVEIPCINLIKLHGSLSWKKDGEDIVFRVERKDLLPDECTLEQIDAFNGEFAVVLPQASKFRTTLMDRTYYELLRIYANELDRENTLLVTFGFSFGDEHIRDITKRALKNPTLRVVAFAYNAEDVDSFRDIFSGHNNVDIIAPPEDGHCDFGAFNSLLSSLLPRAEDGE